MNWLLVIAAVFSVCLAVPPDTVRLGHKKELNRKLFAPSINDAVTNVGTTFFFSFLNSHLKGTTGYTEILSVTVTNANSAPANVQITSPYVNFTTITATVDPNSSLLIPITPADIQTLYLDPEFDIIITENKTLTLTSDQPVSAFGSNTHSDSQNLDKFALIPVCQLGKEYHIVGDESDLVNRFDSSNIFTVIAVEDNTAVTIEDYSSAGPLTYTLKKGEQVSLATFWYTTNILVVADKNVAVIAGSVCGYGYYNQYICNHEVVMLYPIVNYGLSVPFYKFLPQDIGEFMILVQENNTDIYRDGVLIYSNLYVYNYVVFGTYYGNYITSSKPIYGVAVGSTNLRDEGSPFFAHLPSPNNFVSGAVSFPVALTDNEKQLTNFVRITTSLDKIGLITVDNYTPSGLLYKRMGRGNIYCVDVLVQSGTHSVTGSNFSVTVYGYGDVRAYAFTPALNLQNSGDC